MKKNLFLLLTCTTLLLGSQRKDECLYINNQYPLSKNVFIELPLGSIQAEGWLKERLERQREGLTGHLDSIMPLLMGNNNGWLGGDGDQWERAPYWIDGLLPLAYILDDITLIEKVQPWIEWSISSQQKSGYFGPSHSYPNDIPGLQRDNSDDWWPKMVMLKVLQQYYSATSDERIIKLMTNYFHYQLKQLPEKPLDFRTFWPRYRGGDNLMVVLWLYNITNDQKLLELADIIYEQTFDYEETFQKENWWKTGSMHCVNLAQGLKTTAIYAQYRDKKHYSSIAKDGFEDINHYLGYPHGGFGGDEALHGNNPTQGTELCTLVEYLFSLEKMLQITGDLAYAEHIERITFNALPAQSDDDYLTRQYFQQANQIEVSQHNRNFDTNHAGTDNLFSLLSGYPCCTSNMHQGFPKFTQNLWYATEDRGLAAMLYSPSRVTAYVGNNVKITIQEHTNYPFSEKIVFSIDPAESVSFPLYLRQPSWSTPIVININGEAMEAKAVDGRICLNRTWQKGDKVEITMKMEIRLTSWYERSSAVERGPLVYALKMDEKVEKKEHTKDECIWFGKHYYQITSTSAWNYALVERPLDQLNDYYICIEKDEVCKFPWNQANAPIAIQTVGVELPDWKVYNGSAGPLPYSLGYGMHTGATRKIELIPYGCTKLRISEFPMVGNYTIK